MQTQPDLAQRAESTDLVRRSFAFDEFEFRDNDETGGWTFEGVASVVDHPYPVRDQWGEYTETIKSGAFNKTLRDSKANVRLFVNHRQGDVPLATRAAGTLKLTADPHLRVHAELDRARPDVQIIRSAVSRREMAEMSIGFRPVKTRDKWNTDFTEVHRGEVMLAETSIVGDGANTGGTSAEMRVLADFLDSLTDVDMDEAEIRRAITYLETRLPQPEVEAEIVNLFAERDAADLARIARRSPIVGVELLVG